MISGQFSAPSPPAVKAGRFRADQAWARADQGGRIAENLSQGGCAAILHTSE